MSVYKYSNKELIKREQVIQSQIQFGKFLDSDIINHLVYLFNTNIMIKYIEDERKKSNLTNDTIKIKSESYGEHKKNSSLYVGIIKNGIDFLHLTIHLSPNGLNSDKHGMIHFCKDIYIETMMQNNHLSKNKIKKNYGKHLYALISVQKPHAKPNSLEFSVDDDFLTTNLPNATIYDPELEDEMNAILKVLNKLFNEKNDEFYVGNKNKLVPIHNQTNAILENINTRSKFFTRKNFGRTMLPKLSNAPVIVIKPNKKKGTRKASKRSIFTRNTYADEE